ncbi:quercetin dioxygenase-like cupin family protein [Kibdelosporangium phytohabitans]|nr:quercetin dioxygenase-like cupin family protein [Kibdelosporangium phytohabitans]
MRNVHIDRVDSLDRDVVAIGTDYPPGHLAPPQRHRRAQVLYGVSGSMRVETSDGTWTVPPHCAVLIPAGALHAVELGGVSMRSLYTEPRRTPCRRAAGNMGRAAARQRTDPAAALPR